MPNTRRSSRCVQWNIGLPMQYLRLAAKASHLSCQLALPRMNFSSTPLESITRHL